MPASISLRNENHNGFLRMFICAVQKNLFGYQIHLLITTATVISLQSRLTALCSIQIPFQCFTVTRNTRTQFFSSRAMFTFIWIFSVFYECFNGSLDGEWRWILSWRCAHMKRTVYLSGRYSSFPSGSSLSFETKRKRIKGAFRQSSL